MVMPHFVYHFRTDKSKLDEMLSLRGQGWSYTALAEKYECPKLTIRFLARKYGLDGATVVVTVTRADYLRTTIPAIKPDILDEERISPGKTYAEYVREDAERRYRKMLNPL